MNGKSRVEVKIYGQTYTITGDASRDYIKRIAKYVNDKMERVAASSGSISMSSAAVLAAINITEELYQLTEEANKIQQSADKARSEVKNKADEISGYQKLWEETKTSFQACKQELQKAKDTCSRLNEALEKKSEENDGLIQQLSQAQKEAEKKQEKIRALEEQIEKLGQEAEEAHRQALQASQEAEVKKRALEAKEKEFENEFIEVQMKNIKLENEIEKYRKEKRDR